MPLLPRSWAPVVAAGSLTMLTFVVTTLVDARGGETQRDVVQPAARVGENRAEPVESKSPAAPELPRWCRHADACVDRHARVAWLASHGEVVRGPVPVSLGGRGHRTPQGHFHVEWKAEHWTSTEYGIPMPFSVFFATGGIAFHAGPLDVPSHGCVHLRPRDARRFFAALDVGDRVVVR